MTTAYTNLLGLALPVTGELDGTWGDTVNNYITEYTDASIAGVQTISGSQTAVTLSKTTGSSLSQAGSGSTGSSQYQIINCTGNPASLLTITAPATSKTYIVINATSTSQSVKIVGTGPTTGVTIVSTEKAIVAWNGSDFVKVASSLVSQLSGTLSAANGGTGLTSSGANGNVLTSNGTTWTSAALPAGGLTYVVKTSNYTTQDKEGVLADTSGGAFTVTLPATPSVGAQVVVADAAGTWGTNNLTIGRNGSNISGVAQDLVCDISGVSVQLVYDGSSWEIYAQVGGNGGTAVTLTGVQTLTNKTISADNNTLSGIAASSFVLSNASGNIDGSAAQKAIPTGVVVGTTDTQTLTNKTLTSPIITQNVQVIGTNTAAVASRFYVLTASLTLTLPATPTAGDWVSLQNSSGTTTATVARNGSNIMSLAEDMTINTTNVAVTLVYADATRGWVFG